MIDRNSWSKAWQLLGAKDGGPELHRKLVQCWSEGHRHYHTLQHLQECFEHLTGQKIDEKDAAHIAVALWFHDAFYDPKRDDNELRSADWAREEILAAGIDAASAQRVHDMIMATIAHAPQDDEVMQLMVDIDMAIFGSADARFDESDLQVRREYAHIAEADWRVGRRKVLEGFLGRERLYGSEGFYSRFEERARRNIRRSLGRLG